MLTQNVIALNDGLDSLSGKALRGGFGGGLSFAIPSKSFGISVSIDSTVTGSGLLTILEKDTQLLVDYTTATGGYVDVSATFADDLVNFSALTVKLAAFTSDPVNNPILTGAEAAALDLFVLGQDGDASTADTGSIAASEAAVSNYSANDADGNPLISNNNFVGDDPDLVSTAHFFGIAVTDISLGIGRMFNIQDQNLSLIHISEPTRPY